MDENVWEYPFGDLDDDEDMFYRKPDLTGKLPHLPVQESSFLSFSTASGLS
jgi:hypothetical protein